MKYILASPQPFQQKQSGLTLIELLIAMFLGTLLILGATSMFIANKRVYKEVDFQGRLAENARFGMEMMIRDLRMAGFRGCAVNQDVENNLNVKNIMEQSEFLKKIGILERANILSKKMTFKEKANMFYRIKRLLDREEMGNLFKVIFAQKKVKRHVLEKHTILVANNVEKAS